MACMAGERGSPRMLRAPKRPGAKLHPALEPADDLAVGEQAGDVVEQIAFSSAKSLAGCALLRTRMPRPGRS